MARSSLAARLQAAVRIHREIAAGTYPSATRLGELLEVTPKTARKYIGLLTESFGLRPAYDAVQHGYHYPEEVHPDLIPRLTDDEVVAVFLLEAASRSLKGSPAGPLLESVLGKLSLMLPVATGLTLDQVSSALSLRLERAASLPGPEPQVMRTLYTAVVRHRSVRITYRARKGGALTQRTIDPLHLTRCEGQWYLVSFCHLRKAIRTFVPARIQEVRLLAENFTPPKGFDPEEHFRTAFGVVAGYKVAEAVLRFDASVATLIRERRWHATQKLEDLPGGEVRLRMTCSQSQELIAWLLSWGEHVSVEQPAGLAQEVAKAHRRAAAIQRGPKTRAARVSRASGGRVQSIAERAGTPFPSGARKGRRRQGVK
jgi:predicted DNA-binding transcriptional regulator YafY